MADRLGLMIWQDFMFGELIVQLVAQRPELLRHA